MGLRGYNSSVFTICRATSIKNPGFLPLLSQFLIEASVSLPAKDDLDRMESAIRSDRVRFYMAMTEEQRVIGVVSLTMGFSTMRMAPFAMLGDLYVHPGHRGRGAAAALLVSAMDAAHQERCSLVTTNTAAGMEGLFERYKWERSEGTMSYEVDLDGPPPSLTITGELVFD